MIGLPLHKNNIIKSAKLFCDQRKIIHLKNKTKKDLLYHADKGNNIDIQLNRKRVIRLSRHCLVAKNNQDLKYSSVLKHSKMEQVNQYL